MLIDSGSLFWTEKKDNFIKLCFCFSPEIEGSLDSDLESVFAKIAEKINLNEYEVFSGNEKAHKTDIQKIAINLVPDQYLSILIPKDKHYSVDDLEKVLKQKNMKLRDTYKVFYCKQFAEIQKQISNSILIVQNVFIKSEEFVSCPNNASNLVIYSVDLYGNGIQNLEWK